MSSNAVNRTSATNATSPSILTGLIFDETGDRLSPSHANKGGIRYRYYISHRLMQSRRRHEDGWRLPAKEIETPVIDIIHQCLSDRLWLIGMLNIKDQSPRKHQEIFKAANQCAIQIKSGNPIEQKKLLRNFLSRVELHRDKLIIEIDIEKLGNIIQPDVITTTHATGTAQTHRIEVPHKLKKRGVEAKLIIGNDVSPRQDRDPHLILLIAKAHRWFNELTTGNATSIHELAEQLNEDRSEISRFLPLAFLAPDITDKILNGKQPVDLTIRKLRNLPILPTSWEEQRQLLGMST